MQLYKKAAEYLRKGYILTNEKCPNCNSILLKNPKTEERICALCGYSEKLEDIIKEKKKELLILLKKEKDPKRIYYIIKSLLYLEKIYNDKVG